MVMILTLASAAQSEPSMPWLLPVIALLSGIIGTNGVAALLKLRHDKRLGVAQQEVAEDDSEAKRWQSIIETQTRVLLEPMVTKIASLETEQRAIQKELGDTRRKYWSAISHIRVLYTFIARHMPDDVENTVIPEPPATLAEDI